jgi:hypothetical protein
MLLITGVEKLVFSVTTRAYIKTDTQYLPPAAAVGGIVDQLADKPINPNDKKSMYLH